MAETFIDVFVGLLIAYLALSSFGGCTFGRNVRGVEKLIEAGGRPPGLLKPGGEHLAGFECLSTGALRPGA